MNIELREQTSLRREARNIIFEGKVIGDVGPHVYSDNTVNQHAVIRLGEMYPGIGVGNFSLAQGFAETEEAAIAAALRHHWLTLDATVRAVSDLARKLDIGLPSTTAAQAGGEH